MNSSIVNQRGWSIVRWCLALTVSVAVLPAGAQLPQERIQELETALQVQPQEVRYLVELGRLYAEVGRIRDGLTLLERAVGIAPQHPGARAWLGSLQVRMARTTQGTSEQLQWFKKGTRSMDEAVEEFPDVAVVYLIRGISGVLIPDRFQRYLISIQDFNKVLELKAQDPTALPDAQMPLVYLNLGLAYKKNNQKAEARATWEQGRQRYPQSKETAQMGQELNTL